MSIGMHFIATQTKRRKYDKHFGDYGEIDLNSGKTNQSPERNKKKIIELNRLTDFNLNALKWCLIAPIYFGPSIIQSLLQFIASLKKKDDAKAKEKRAESHQIKNERK